MLATSTPMSLHRSTKDDGFTVDVVSAEGVFLRSDRQKLSVASPVLRDLLVVSGTTVRVPEPADALSQFLEVVSGLADVFPIINNRASILGALPVMRLLAKYSCTVHLTAARTALTCLVMEHDVCPLEVFVLGAAVRDIALCRTAIVYGDDGDDLAPRDAEARAAALQSYWHDVDPVYRAALAKAWEVQDPKDRGNRFVEAMCLEEDKPKHEVEVAPTLKAAVQPALAKVSPTGYQANRYVVDEDPFLSDDE